MKLLSKTENRRSKAFSFPVSFLALAFIFAAQIGFASDPVKAGGSPSAEATPAFKGAGFNASLSSNRAYNGSIIVVRVDLDKKETLTGRFEEIDLPFFPVPEVSEKTYEAVLGVPYEHKPGLAKIELQIGAEKKSTLSFEVTAGTYGSEKLKVNARKVNPKKSDMVRINKEIAEIKPLYKIVTEKKYWSGAFDLPIHSKITSEFGTRRLYNGEPRGFHPGLDLLAPMNTPIHAPAGGVVALAKSLFFTGNTVVLDHGYGLVTIYAHMTTLKVKKGDIVKSGNLLGLSGKTGRVTGPHLHWGAIIHGQKVNPFELTKLQ